MNRLKAIIEETPELLGGNVTTPVVETSTEIAERRAAAVQRARDTIQRTIADLERNLGPVPAFRITRHLSEAFDAAGKVERKER